MGVAVAGIWGGKGVGEPVGLGGCGFDDVGGSTYMVVVLFRCGECLDWIGEWGVEGSCVNVAGMIGGLMSGEQI